MTSWLVLKRSVRLTIEYQDKRHHIAPEQALGYIDKPRQPSEDVPSGSVLDTCIKAGVG
jgi:hypothetical protein